MPPLPLVAMIAARTHRLARFAVVLSCPRRVRLPPFAAVSERNSAAGPTVSFRHRFRRERMHSRATPRTAFRGLVGALVPLVVGPIARAADVGRGRSLAQVFCSQCHFVTTNQTGWMNAPSFVAIANDPATTSTWLEIFIETPHPEMASRTARSPSDAVDLAAYILSLKQK
jgi:mono/diheme cytochrome c family protein